MARRRSFLRRSLSGERKKQLKTRGEYAIIVKVIILLQEGKSAGLGAIAGAADTYWGRNKGRSMEGRLVTGTKILVALFIIIAAVLNLGIF